MNIIQSYAPVQLRTRKDGWSPARQWEFLQALGDMGSVNMAAAHCGMTVRSAHRLRKHPDAEGFRIAWDAALSNAWRRVEQIAIDRMINGEVETIEREGYLVMTRRRPCSDRLLIYMLKEQVRRMAEQAAEVAATNKALAAKVREEALVAGARTGRRAAVAPIVWVTAATRETEALRDFHNCVQELPDSKGWEGDAGDLEGAAPALPMLDKLLAPADGRIEVKVRGGKVRSEAVRDLKARDAEVSGVEVVRKVSYLPYGTDFSSEIGGGAYTSRRWDADGVEI